MDVLVSRIRLVFQSNASKLPDPLSRKRIKCLTIKIIVTTSSPFVVSSLHKCMRITLGWFCVHIYLNTYIQLLSLRYSKKKKDPHFHKSHGDKSWPRDWHVDKCIYNHLMLGALMPFGGINLVPLNFPASTHPMDAWSRSSHNRKNRRYTFVYREEYLNPLTTISLTGSVGAGNNRYRDFLGLPLRTGKYLGRSVCFSTIRSCPCAWLRTGA